MLPVLFNNYLDYRFSVISNQDPFIHGNIDLKIIKCVSCVSYLQTTMSVHWAQTIVIQMRSAQISREVSAVLVLMATVERECAV